MENFLSNEFMDLIKFIISSLLFSELLSISSETFFILFIFNSASFMLSPNLFTILTIFNNSLDCLLVPLATSFIDKYIFSVD